jgi:hypothetical protein
MRSEKPKPSVRNVKWAVRAVAVRVAFEDLRTSSTNGAGFPLVSLGGLVAAFALASALVHVGAAAFVEHRRVAQQLLWHVVLLPLAAAAGGFLAFATPLASVLAPFAR